MKRLTSKILFFPIHERATHELFIDALVDVEAFRRYINRTRRPLIVFSYHRELVHVAREIVVEYLHRKYPVPCAPSRGRN